MHYQAYYAFEGDEWVAQENRSAAGAAQQSPSKFRVLTWNIDFQTQAQKLRMAAALRYLDELQESFRSRDDEQGFPTLPLVIMLQEMTRITIDVMNDTAWIQEKFYMTDISTGNWPSPEYGTVTQIDRRLAVAGVYRVPFESQMQRDGLFVDLSMPQHDSTASVESRTIRLCNVHLESLAFEPSLRPGQVKIVGEHLHEHGISAGVVAGDTNAIQDF